MLLKNTWRVYLFSGFLFFLTLSVKGNKIDSLIRVYEQSANDTIRCLNARMIGHAYRKEGNRVSTFQWFETAEKIAIRSGIMIQLLRTYEWWTQIAGDGFNDRQLVIDSLRKELLMAKNRKDISVQIRISQIIATMLQNQMASYDKAYKEWLDVEKLVQQQPDLLAAKAISIPLFNNLGWLLTKQGNPGASIPYYRKSIALSDQFGLKGNSLQLMADLAGSLYAAGKIDEAILMLKDKLKEIPKEKEPQVISRYNEILALIYTKENKFDTALTYALNSLYKDAGFAVYAFRNIQVANCYYKLGNYDSALHYGLTGLEIAETNKLNKERFDSHEVLKEIYRAKGNYKEALHHYILYSKLQDEQNSFQIAMNISGINAEREKEREELQKALADAELARQKRIKTTFLIGAVAAMLVLLYIIVQHKKLQKEKNRSEELLLNILPYETSEELKATGMVEARKYSGASILFTDFVGFTEISSQVSPEELLRLLNECFSAFDRIIEKHQLEKIKTIGDAYMAAGGLPKPKASHAFDIVSAALDIRDFIKQMIAAKRSAGKQFFEIRIGVNSGPIVAGIVGIKKFQYDIWGDTVNIASRMESSGEIGKVNISASTYELLKDKQEFSFISRGKIKVKGKGEMEMYIVERKA